MKKKILLFLSLIFSLLFFVSCSSKEKAEDDVITLDFGHFQNPGHALYIAPEEFKELVENRTDGKVKINLYPASQLGSAREMMEQVSMGALDITVADASDWASTFNIPELGVFNLPFLSEDLDMQAEIIKQIVPEEVPKMLKDSRFHLLMTYSNGMREPLTRTKPIHTLEDIKGMKMRTAETKLYIDLWNALGASTVTSAWSEVYTLLQQGVADAVEADDVGLVSQNLQEVGKYMSNLGHLGQTYLVLVNEEKWESIPEDLRNIIEECALENQTKQLGDRKILGEEAVETIKEAGVEVNDISKEERQRMKEACKSIYDEYSEKYGLSKLIEKMENIE